MFMAPRSTKHPSKRLVTFVLFLKRLPRLLLQLQTGLLQWRGRDNPCVVSRLDRKKILKTNCFLLPADLNK